MSVLVIDNHGSFTYNLAHQVWGLGLTPIVVPNHHDPHQMPDGLTHILVSPGPGRPEQPRSVGNCMQVFERCIGTVPILGVCLGLQAIAFYFGARIMRLPAVRHAVESELDIVRASCLFRGVPSPTTVMRYHSLQVDESSLPDQVVVTSLAIDDGAVMSVEVPDQLVYGVQFHPESVATPLGTDIVANFLSITGANAHA